MSNDTTTPVTTKSFPKGEAIYVARFEENLTWSEMRAHFSVSARSSRFLSECVHYVQQNEELIAKHPEFAAIDATDKETIRAERMRGVGLALLVERTGLKMAALRKIVGEEVGTTSRVAWGARYGGRKVTVTEENAPVIEEGALTEEGAQVVEEAIAEVAAEPAKPATRRRSRAKKSAPASK